ncbi:MAG: hypothetical protein RML93_01730 [Anaerolineales bacterium]|nr:hypothetical protein [Anaerolineales bacterium]MDW8445993.1 hypothetical protein [Anaerolineales bacterium]
MNKSLRYTCRAVLIRLQPLPLCVYLIDALQSGAAMPDFDFRLLLGLQKPRPEI